MKSITKLNCLDISLKCLLYNKLLCNDNIIDKIVFVDFSMSTIIYLVGIEVKWNLNKHNYYLTTNTVFYIKTNASFLLSDFAYLIERYELQ